MKSWSEKVGKSDVSDKFQHVAKIYGTQILEVNC